MLTIEINIETLIDIEKQPLSVVDDEADILELVA